MQKYDIHFGEKAKKATEAALNGFPLCRMKFIFLPNCKV